MENTAHQQVERAKSGPKDVFLYVLSIITLYAFAAALIDILFNFINVAFPEGAGDPYAAQSILASVRFDISVLIIVFPAYLIVNWLIRKSYIAAPEKRQLRVRKWLIYLTLFIASLVLIVD